MIYAVDTNSSSFSDSVSVIDGKKNEVVDDITLNHVTSSEYIEVNPKTNIICIASSTSDSVSVIDGTTQQIITDQ